MVHIAMILPPKCSKEYLIHQRYLQDSLEQFCSRIMAICKMSLTDLTYFTNSYYLTIIKLKILMKLWTELILMFYSCILCNSRENSTSRTILHAELWLYVPCHLLAGHFSPNLTTWWTLNFKFVTNLLIRLILMFSYSNLWKINF